MSGGETNPQNQRSESYSELTQKVNQVYNAIHSTETPIGLRIEVRDIRRTLDGYAREKGVVERLEILETSINTKLQGIETQVDTLQAKLNNLQSSGEVKEAKQEGAKVGRGALIGGIVTFLTILSIASAIISTWLARWNPLP